MPLMKPSRICVLGAAGFIGRHVVSECLSRGSSVVAVDIVDRMSPHLANHSRLEFRQGALTDETFVRSALEGCDAVICLAPASLPATSNADMAGEVMASVHATVKIAEIACELGVRNFVFASSGGTVYGIDSPDALPENAPTQPRNAYGVSKLAIEHYLRVLRDLRGMHTVSLRIANPYGVGQNAGNGQGFIAMAMRRAFGGESMTIWGDGSVVRDFIFVKDLAEAICAGAEYTGAEPAINIGSGLGYSLREVARMVESISGRKLELVFEPNRRIDVAHNVLDISLAFRELGWRPSTAIESGLLATAEWWETRRISQQT
ncbi:NAD-dependent epimerase/dehydratase family protein [Oceanicella sp. SM1341]|uniref:NAD-dependent epimerase/dehydratase family protein n=1 Tax=Oceanicella sp. SM1341 TaxID=1548889 RepID=UPI000E48630F